MFSGNYLSIQWILLSIPHSVLKKVEGELQESLMTTDQWRAQQGLQVGIDVRPLLLQECLVFVECSPTRKYKVWYFAILQRYWEVVNLEIPHEMVVNSYSKWSLVWLLVNIRHSDPYLRFAWILIPMLTCFCIWEWRYVKSPYSRNTSHTSLLPLLLCFLTEMT